jgi:hypothetical protein
MSALKIFFLLSIASFLSCKAVRLRTVCKHPPQLSEASGLIAASPNAFWSFNDSGGEPKLYEFDSSGTMRRFIYIKNATNVDWEEITIDHKNNVLYIGDFGNNSQARRDLVIYKINNISAIHMVNLPDTVTAERIEFVYEDQTAFPPPDILKTFDAEAMLVNSDSIYIFTKDFYSKPYKGITRIYTLPTRPGKHIAQLSGVFETDESWKYRGAITAAAMGSTGKIALLSYQKIWVWQNQSTLEQFWLNPAKKLRFGLHQFSQKEGMAFDKNNDCILYINSEKVKILGGHLTRFDICNKLKADEENRTVLHLKQLKYPPSVGNTIWEGTSAFKTDGYMKIYNVQGENIASKTYFHQEDKIVIENAVFPESGMYFYALFQKDNLPLTRGKILIIK